MPCKKKFNHSCFTHRAFIISWSYIIFMLLCTSTCLEYLLGLTLNYIMPHVQVLMLTLRSLPVFIWRSILPSLGKGPAVDPLTSTCLLLFHHLQANLLYIFIFRLSVYIFFSLCISIYLTLVIYCSVSLLGRSNALYIYRIVLLS